MKRLILIVAVLSLTGGHLFALTISQADRDRAADILSKMTVEEKCRLISGQVDNFHTYPIERLGVRSTLMADATMGVRQMGDTPTNCTCFPAGIAMAASFNRDAAAVAGKAVALDCKARGVGILLGPGVNMYRNALCGRNFEYMGEDPYLSGEMASSYIRGMQEEGVMATVKHFALNNQEYDRHMTASYADERTMNEIYFPAFKAAVCKGGAAAVMSSYNPVNGAHASDNAPLLQNLRDWGFEGIIMSDWTSTYTTIGCIASPLDLECPGNQCFTPERIMPLLEKGIVTEGQIDAKCLHILQTLSAFNLLDKDITDSSLPLDNPQNCEKALQTAREGIVLLKNNGVLPIKPSKKGTVLLTGPNADKFVEGGGSSVVFPFPGRVTTLKDGLCALGKGYNIVFKQFPSEEEIKNASAVIFAIGFDQNTELERVDRKFKPFYRRDPQERELCFAVEHSDKVVVVVNAGGEIDLGGWGDKAAAILYAWYPGQAGGTALAEIISGRISPSGRLPFTFWGSLEKNPTSNYYNNVVISPRSEATRYPMMEYGEGVFLGYRGIDKFGVQPLYPFGHGLTYSTFEYSGLKAAVEGENVKVSFTLKNTGKVAAVEVAQIYVSPVDPSVPRPVRELKEFSKVSLKAGESREVAVTLPRDAFAHYDMGIHGWKVDDGSYVIEAGASATDIRTSARIDYR